MGGLEEKAQSMAKLITDDLGGYGLFGVEFFIRNGDVIFSELSPRPHDTGLLTLYTQNLSEFDLHARAILHLPISDILVCGRAHATPLMPPRIAINTPFMAWRGRSHGGCGGHVVRQT